MNIASAPAFLKVERRPLTPSKARPSLAIRPGTRPKVAIRAKGDAGATLLKNHFRLAYEVRERSSSGQETAVGVRNVDASPPIDRYFNRGELDDNEYRNERLYRAAQRLKESFMASNLERKGVSNYMPAQSSGIPDKWATIRLDELRKYDRAMKSMGGEQREIVSFVVVYEGGHARDWARLKGVSERGAIKFLRLGLYDLAIYYGLLKRPRQDAAILS